MWLAAPLLAGCAAATPEPYDIPPASTVNAATRPSGAFEFWWGVSTAAYQTEEPLPSGGSAYCTDWDLFHRAGKLKHLRDDRIAACANRERDLEAMKYLGITHYRFGVEWARVEPKAGSFDQTAIDDYVALARSLRDAGITPIACLWHFTFPDWLSDMHSAWGHGWLHPKSEAAWGEYVRRMAQALGPHVSIFAPQNEPNMYALATTIGLFPPGQKLGKDFYDKLTAVEVQRFIQSARIIREERPGAEIMSIQNIIHWERGALDWFGIWYRMAEDFNVTHLDGIKQELDYVGFNYYHREVASPLALWAQSQRRGPSVSDLGWITDPQGLQREIVRLSTRYRKPLVITENGIADKSDHKRPQYLLAHLSAIHEALEAGYDVRGYFHWTLTDDYEWMLGYEPKYGLFAIDPASKALTPKFSARLYRRLIQEGFPGAEATWSPSPTTQAMIAP